jgi:hypothetical protein
MPLDLTTNKAYLRTIQIYENEKQFYFIGSHSINKTLLIFTISKLKFTGNSTGCYELKDILIEHQKEYDKDSFDELILALSKEASTQLRFIEEVKCIFGFVKFYFGHYAILVSEYSKVGKIGDYIINRVEKLKLLPLFLVNTTNVYLEIESKYLTIFKNFDPSRQVYFSFTYDLTKTLQRNFLENLKKETIKEYFEIFLTKNINNEKIQTLKNTTNNTFLWNNYHIKEFFKIIENKLWATFFIYGFFEQIECMNYGLRFLVTVIARRNRNYAGTRYLKRGINDDGNVANDVETEQILEEISTSCAEKPVISSYIHIRGSVPIYWYQEQNGIMPKPDIKVNYWDVFYESTKRHFFLLNQRYGSPIISCNLTKKKEGDHKQEELLNESYQAGVDYINIDLKLEEKIMYLHYDLKNERRQAKFYRHFYEISYGLIEKTNMFSFIPDIRSNSTYNLELQSGVIRSNCVDCLDRTNVFQQVIGTAVMVNQLRSMGVNAKEPNNEEHMFGILTELYKKMGHELSSQYAGSLAHKQTIKDNRTMMNKIIDKVPEIFNTCKRYFNNSFNDQYKQASINLFLGKYKIGKMPGHLWDLTTDSMLHRKERTEKIKK